MCVVPYKFLPETCTNCFGASLSEKSVYGKLKESTASQELQKA